MSTDLLMFGFDHVPVVRPNLPALRGGIDPGKHGWVVVEMSDGTLRSWQVPVDEDGKYDLKAFKVIALELKRLGVTHITLEAQQPTRLRGSQPGMANNAVRASFMTGYGFALWEMVLTMVGIDYDLAWPSAWKKKMGILAPSSVKDQKKREKETKRLAIAEGQRLHPDHDFRRTPRCKPSHDQCEAALLIHYGRKKGWGS